MDLRLKKRVGLTVALLAVASAAAAAVFPYFGPITGILKGNANSGITTAAAASDVTVLFGCGGSGTLWLNGAGGCTAPASASGANPTGTVGLSAVNGSATSFMRSDAAPALSQAISPTMTGNWTFTPTSGVGLTVNANASTGLAVNGSNGHWSLSVTGGATGVEDGMLLNAGSNTSDYALYVRNQAGSSDYFKVIGDGGAVVGSATGGDKGIGTLNAQGLYVNGVAVGTSTSPQIRNGSVYFTSSGSCTILNSGGGLVTGCTPLGTGWGHILYSAFSTGVYNCVVSADNSSGGASNYAVGTNNGNGDEIVIVGTGSAAAGVSMICIGH